MTVPILSFSAPRCPGRAELGWKAVVLSIAVLLLRRPPVILLLRPFLSGVRSRTDAQFMGWFGPIAVAAIYYASVTEQRLPGSEIWNVVSLVIFSSVIAHGLTGAPLTRLYGKRAGSRTT